MTSSPKVWGDALRRLQNEIPDFAIDAWIAPLAVKIHCGRLVLGCPTIFHRDRVRLHHLDAIERCWSAAFISTAKADEPSDSVPASGVVDLLIRSEFADAPGTTVDSRAVLRDQAALESRTRMRKVETVPKARTVNGSDQNLGPLLSPPQSAAEGHHGATAFRQNHGQGLTSSPSDIPMLPGPSWNAPHAAPSTAASAGASRSTDQSLDLRAVPNTAQRKRAPKVRDDSKLPGDAPHSAGAESAGARFAGTSEARLPGSPPTGPKGDLNFDLDGDSSAGEPFSFESFIVGPCNALAREATLALARRRQHSLNQLYLGGASGMGKTHLARAAASEARRMVQVAASNALSNSQFRGADPRRAPQSRSMSNRDPRGTRRVIYTTAEQFTNDFVSAMRNGRNDEWTRRYRGTIDLLVVEDIHSFSGRTKTQEELAHTISHVLDSGGRVLLTGDRAPRNLTGLDESLRAQVSRGFVAELDRPDRLVRRHILRAKAAAGGVNLPPDCLDLLVNATGCEADAGGGFAERGMQPTDSITPQRETLLAGSVRDLESVLIQVVTTASLLGRPIDVDLTREAIELKSGASTTLEPAKLNVSEVVQIVSAFFGKRPEALASRSRRRDVLIPRQLAMYLSHRYTDASLTEIGRGLGRDHPSVRNALTRVERQVLENAPLRYQVEALSERIDRRLEDARSPRA
jgi:chromosomal replication initiator protein